MWGETIVSDYCWKSLPLFRATGCLSSLPLQLRLVVHGERWPQVKTPSYHSSLGTAEKHGYRRTVSTAGHCPKFHTAVKSIYELKLCKGCQAWPFFNQSIINRVFSVFCVVILFLLSING